MSDIKLSASDLLSGRRVEVVLLDDENCRIVMVYPLSAKTVADPGKAASVAYDIDPDCKTLLFDAACSPMFEGDHELLYLITPKKQATTSDDGGLTVLFISRGVHYILRCLGGSACKVIAAKSDGINNALAGHHILVKWNMSVPSKPAVDSKS